MRPMYVILQRVMSDLPITPEEAEAALAHLKERNRRNKIGDNIWSAVVLGVMLVWGFIVIVNWLYK